VGRATRRETFHTSPHLAHRQYVLTSGRFDVVVIDDDWQAGHVAGVSASACDCGPLRGGSNERTGLSIDLPHDFTQGYFHLCGDRNPARIGDARRTPASELSGTKTRKNCELERGEFNGTLYHRDHPFVSNAETSGAGAEEEPVAMQPSQQGFGEGWAKMA
jgi:hypothetical protein